MLFPFFVHGSKVNETGQGTVGQFAIAPPEFVSAP